MIILPLLYDLTRLRITGIFSVFFTAFIVDQMSGIKKSTDRSKRFIFYYKFVTADEALCCNLTDRQVGRKTDMRFTS